MMLSSNTNPGCLAALAAFFQQFLPGQKKNASKPLPYRVRDDFLTPAELSFYRVLLHVTAGHVTVCPKVRLADLFFVSHPDRNRRFFNYIVAKHVDFVLCAPQTMRPLLAIELDDSSHKSFDRNERDEFVGRVFADAHVPLVRIPARRQYGVGELRALLAEHLPVGTEAGAVRAAGAAHETEPAAVKAAGVQTAYAGAGAANGPKTAANISAPLCPKCGVPMVLRTVAQGEQRGRQFYGCRNFPHCREVRPYSL